MNRMVPLEAIAQYQYPSNYQYALYDPAKEYGEEYFTEEDLKAMSPAGKTVLGLLLLGSIGLGGWGGVKLMDKVPDSADRFAYGRGKLWLWALLMLILVAVVSVLLNLAYPPASFIISAGLGVAGLVMLYLTLGRLGVDWWAGK